MHRLFILSLIAATALFAQAAGRVPIQDDLWREYDLYRDRLMQLARAIPEEKYDWRPAEGVRSIKEVILHVSLNNYMLLERMGEHAPDDLFKDVTTAGTDRPRDVYRKTVQYEKSMMGKNKVLLVADQAWTATTAKMKTTTAQEFGKGVTWGNWQTSVGGLQLRVVAHLHEHLGQLIAYARTVGVKPPWSE